MTQIAVHPDPFRRGHHEVGGRRSLLLGPVLGVRADVDDLLRVAELVDDLVALVEQVIQVPEDRPEVLAGRDGAPAPDGMEPNRHRTLGKERRHVVGLHGVGMIDAKHEERDAV